jgi:hypothetical protein
MPPMPPSSPPNGVQPAVIVVLVSVGVIVLVLIVVLVGLYLCAPSQIGADGFRRRRITGAEMTTPLASGDAAASLPSPPGGACGGNASQNIDRLNSMVGAGGGNGGGNPREPNRRQKALFGVTQKQRERAQRSAPGTFEALNMLAQRNEAEAAASANVGAVAPLQAVDGGSAEASHSTC